MLMSSKCLLSELHDSILQQIAAYCDPCTNPVVSKAVVVFQDEPDVDEEFNKTSIMKTLSAAIRLNVSDYACWLDLEDTCGDALPWEEHFVFDPTKSGHRIVTPTNDETYIVIGNNIKGTVYRCGGLSQLAKRFTKKLLTFNCILHGEVEIEGPNENTSASVTMYIRAV